MGRKLFVTDIEFSGKTISVSGLSSRKSEKLGFSLLCPKHHKINMVNKCWDCDKDYNRSDLVKGYKMGKDKDGNDDYKPIPDELFKHIETSNIRIRQFVKPTPKLMFDIMRSVRNAYFLTPYADNKKKLAEKDRNNEQFYSFFYQLMAKNGLIGLGRFNVFRSENYIALMPFNDVFVVFLLHYPDELIDVPSVNHIKLDNDYTELGKKLIEKIDEVIEVKRTAQAEIEEYILNGKIPKPQKKPTEKAVSVEQFAKELMAI